MAPLRKVYLFFWIALGLAVLGLGQLWTQAQALNRGVKLNSMEGLSALASGIIAALGLVVLSRIVYRLSQR